MPVVGTQRLTSVWEVKRAAEASVPSPGSPYLPALPCLAISVPCPAPSVGLNPKGGGGNVTIIPVSHCHLGSKVLIPNQLFGLSA